MLNSSAHNYDSTFIKSYMALFALRCRISMGCGHSITFNNNN